MDTYATLSLQNSIASVNLLTENVTREMNLSQLNALWSLPGSMVKVESPVTVSDYLLKLTNQQGWFKIHLCLRFILRSLELIGLKEE
jgi:hypothetical protein